MNGKQKTLCKWRVHLHRVFLLLFQIFRVRRTRSRRRRERSWGLRGYPSTSVLAGRKPAKIVNMYMFALLANLLLSKIISWLTLRFFTVFYSLCRTAGDTSHTVSTILPPDRPAAFKMDIIQRAACFTLSASSTFFCYSKTFSVDHHGIHQRIEHLGHDCLTRLFLRQPLLVTNHLCNLYNFRLCLL